MSNLTDSISCSLNICQRNGQCFLTNSSNANFTCLCTACYTGSFCEIEKYSRNLWYMGISNDKRFENYQIIEAIVGFAVAIVSFISNVLALQTFLCSKKIRNTNLGIYLILLSLSCLIISIIRGVFTSIAVFSNSAKLGSSYSLFQCAVMRLFASSVIYCLFWILLYITVERFLIEYSFVGLYDSRRRSLISSLFLYSIVLVTNIFINIFGTIGSYASPNFCRLNFTSTGYIFYSIFRWINYLAAPIALLISCLFILHHLVRHRIKFTTDRSVLWSSIKLIISNHPDFILLPLIFILCVMPYFILSHVVTCSTADSFFLGKVSTIVQLLSDLALVIPFFTAIIPSKFYMEQFWEPSYVGRFLMDVKKKLCAGMCRTSD